MGGFYQTIIHTPVWVSLLLYLLRLGFRASKTRVVPLKKMFIMPIIFSVMSIHTLLSTVSLTNTIIGCWLSALIIGAGMGWWQIFRLKIAVDKVHYLVRVPGTWSTLLFILIIFASKYYFGYMLTVYPQLATQSSFVMSLLIVSGICTGLFLGRLVCYIQHLIIEPQTNLSGGITY